MIVVAGTAGAEPEHLARRLEELSDEPPCAVGLLALDLTIAAGSDEELLLSGLLGEGGPVALVGVGAGQVVGWQERLAAARERLDPERHLPVFAVAVDVAAEQGGLNDLAAWCAAPQWAAAGPLAKSPARAPAPEPAPAGGGRQRRQTAPAAERPVTDRLAGARAGLAELRVALSAQIRAGAYELNQRASSSCEGLRSRDIPAFTAWLEESLAHYRRRILDELAAGTDHLRAAALVGTTAGQQAGWSGPVRENAATPSCEPDAERRISADELVLLALGASAGLGAGRVTVAPLMAWAGLGALGTILTVLVGLAVAAGVVAVRRQGAARAAVRRRTAESIAAMRSAVEHAVAAGLGAAEAQIGRELCFRPRVVEPDGASVRPTL